MKLFKWGCVVGLVFVLEASLPSSGGISIVSSSEQRSNDVISGVSETKSQENLQLLLEEKLRLIQLLLRFA